MNERDVDCKDLVELATDYLEQSLASGDRDDIERHLGVCPGCREYIRQMELTRQALAAGDVRTMAPKTRQALLQAFRAWKTDADA